MYSSAGRVMGVKPLEGLILISPALRQRIKFRCHDVKKCFANHREQPNSIYTIYTPIVF